MFQNVDDILLVRSHLVFITSSKYHGDSYINSYCGKCCIHFIIVHATKNVVQEMLCLRCYLYICKLQLITWIPFNKSYGKY